MIHVVFDCDDPPTHLVTLLGPDRPDVSSGYGGWEEVERPRRTTVTTWRGQPARRMALSVVIDNWLDNTAGGPHSVEDQIRQLERMALPRPGGQPPVVSVSAAGGVIPPAYERLPWVIDAFSWGDALANDSWNRVRQSATVTLLEYVADDLLEKRSPAKKQRAKRARKTGKNRKKGARNKRAASKGKHKGADALLSPAALASVQHFDGEDLLSVAARELGDARRWIEIAELSGIRDPRAVKRGQVIRLP
jgi:hypothetical protein